MKINTIKLKEINPHIICALCNGYLINATTTIDCLHTFCKSCIYNHLQSQTTDKKCCPICETFLNRSKPSESLRPDPVLQNIVYSVVPNLYSLERERKTRFYEGEKVRQNILSSPNPSLDAIFGPEKPTIRNDSFFEVSLKYVLGDKNQNRSIANSIFKTPSRVSLTDLEQILRAKYALGDNNFLEFYFSPYSDCIKKYLSVEEIYKVLESHSLVEDEIQQPLLLKDKLAAPKTHKLDIFYKVYAVKRKRRLDSNGSNQAEERRSKSPKKSKSEAKLKPYVQKGAEKLSENNEETVVETDDQTSSSPKFSINSLLQKNM